MSEIFYRFKILFSLLVTSGLLVHIDKGSSSDLSLNYSPNNSGLNFDFIYKLVSLFDTFLRYEYCVNSFVSDSA